MLHTGQSNRSCRYACTAHIERSSYAKLHPTIRVGGGSGVFATRPIEWTTRQHIFYTKCPTNIQSSSGTRKSPWSRKFEYATPNKSDFGHSLKITVQNTSFPAIAERLPRARCTQLPKSLVHFDRSPQNTSMYTIIFMYRRVTSGLPSFVACSAMGR